MFLAILGPPTHLWINSTVNQQKIAIFWPHPPTSLLTSYLNGPLWPYILASNHNYSCLSYQWHRKQTSVTTYLLQILFLTGWALLLLYCVFDCCTVSCGTVPLSASSFSSIFLIMMVLLACHLFLSFPALQQQEGKIIIRTMQCTCQDSKVRCG